MGALEYASDEIKCDSKFAMEFIHILNEKNKDPESYFIDVNGVEYLSMNVFSDVVVVEEMIKYTPHEFISKLMYRNDSAKELFEILKQFNNIIAPAVKKEFEVDIKAALTLVNNDEAVSEKTSQVDNILKKYDMGNLMYGAEFELNNFAEGGYQETPLWIELKRRIESEVMIPLSDQASSFLDYKGLIDMIIPQGTYTLYADIDRVRIKEFYEKLSEYLDEAEADALGYAFIMENGYLEIDDEFPDIANEIMNKLGEKLFEMDIESAIDTMANLDYKCTYLPKNVKSKLLERLESLSDEKKEELYVDEYIEYFSE